MGNTLIVDSDILIDFFRKEFNAIKWVNENKNKFNLTTTIINVFELYTGVYKAYNTNEKIKELENFLNTIKIFDLTIDCVKEAGKIRANLERSGQTLESRDILISSIAISNNSPLKTNNKKHFERIDGLKLID